MKTDERRKSELDISVARNAIVQALKNNNKKTGVCDCPVCGGKETLAFSINHTGGISGCCRTYACVDWMK